MAERVFAEKGFEGSNLREISQHAEIQMPGLYRHFSNKEALYQAVLDRSLGPMLELMLQFSTQKLSLENLEKEAVGLIDQVMDMLAKHPHISFLFQQAVMAAPHSQTQTNIWLNTLLDNGRLLISATDDSANSSGEEETVLRLIAVFNLCVGYFSSANIMQNFLGKSPSDKELLEKQKTLLISIASLWLKS